LSAASGQFRSWQVWSLFLVGSESNVGHWQGAALKADRPLISWLVLGWRWGRFGRPKLASLEQVSRRLRKQLHWQGAALDAGRPFAGLCLSGKSGARFLSVQKGTLSTGRGELWKPGVWVVSGEGDVSEARNWQVWS